MGKLVTEGQIKTYKYFINQIREDIGRHVTVHLMGPQVHCPNCLTDPQNKKSTNMYSPKSPFPTNLVGYNGATSATPFVGGVCPWCNGTAQVTSETTKTVQAGVRWLKTGQERYLIQGASAENDVRLKVDIKYKQIFTDARVVEVDGSPFQVKLIVPGGLRDLIQIQVFLKNSEWPTGRKSDVNRY